MQGRDAAESTQAQHVSQQHSPACAMLQDSALSSLHFDQNGRYNHPAFLSMAAQLVSLISRTTCDRRA